VPLALAADTAWAGECWVVEVVMSSTLVLADIQPGRSLHIASPTTTGWGRATTKRIGSLVRPPALSLTALLRYLPLTGRALFLMSRCGAVLCPVVG